MLFHSKLKPTRLWSFRLIEKLIVRKNTGGKIRFVKNFHYIYKIGKSIQISIKT